MSPPRRFRKPYLPISPQSRGGNVVIRMERLIKGVLFNCSMCGNCLLQETAFICPLLCPKGLRNGPCGSGSVDICCVDPLRPCIWHLIYHRADMFGRLDRLQEIQAPLDWFHIGRETWGTVISESRERRLFSLKKETSNQRWRDQIQLMFRDIRQPDWWQGDDQYHPPSEKGYVSRLQASLEQGEFVITAEVAPPAGANVTKVQEIALRFQGLIHAANVTQNPMATTRMSSLACCLLLNQSGIEPVLQLTARDYNRLSLQSEVLGAAALGIQNVLCLTGDAPTIGRGPAGGLPFDLDSTQMLWILRRLRDEERFLDGRKVNGPPQIFLGAAGSPNDPIPQHEALRLEKKINAGAQFIQTQLVYDVSLLERWLDALDERDLLSKVHILVGVGPLRSPKVAHFLKERIPDIVVPDSIVEQLEMSTNPEETGVELTLELIRKIKALPGIRGIHIMSLGWEAILPRLVNEVREVTAFPAGP